MFRRKGQKTLREDVEALRGRENKPQKRKIGYIFIFLLLILVGIRFPGYIIMIEGLICLYSLFQYKLTCHRTKKDKSNLQKGYKKKVGMLPWAILAVYFAFFAVVLTVFGVIEYVLQMPARFTVWEWLEKSIPVFLFFEIVVLQLNIRTEREA